MATAVNAIQSQIKYCQSKGQEILIHTTLAEMKKTIAFGKKQVLLSQAW